MVVRVNSEVLSQASLIPRPEVSDSDDVLLALEAARALETQGEFREAARWLRRAADEAERQGNDERVLALARAAADLTSAIGSSPPAGDAITMPPPSMPPPSIPPASQDMFDGIGAEYATTTPPSDSFGPTIPPPASMPAAAAPVPAPASATVPTSSPLPSDMPLTERSMRIGAVRVAIVESSLRGAKSFSVERLDRGQPVPAGAIEAMLVFSGEHDSAAEEDFDLLAGSDSRP